ncbi:MAG: nucleoside-triphosphatase [Chloroflexota bacterium]
MHDLLNSPDSLLASFASENEPGRLIIVTGPSGSGKTHWCLALADYARSLGVDVGGLVSPAVQEAGLKTGIELLDLRSGARRRLAVRRAESVTGPITEDWHFDNEALRWGNAVLVRSKKCQLLILDELGPLELLQGVGLTVGLRLVSARRYRLACVVVRLSLLSKAQALWPWEQTFHIPSENPKGVLA